MVGSTLFFLLLYLKSRELVAFQLYDRTNELYGSFSDLLLLRLDRIAATIRFIKKTLLLSGLFLNRFSERFFLLLSRFEEEFSTFELGELYLRLVSIRILLSILLSGEQVDLSASELYLNSLALLFRRSVSEEFKLKLV